jgi:hypothetical protein
VGGQKVLSRSAADSFAVGQRQKIKQICHVLKTRCVELIGTQLVHIENLASQLIPIPEKKATVTWNFSMLKVLKTAVPKKTEHVSVTRSVAYEYSIILPNMILNFLYRWLIVNPVVMASLQDKHGAMNII